MDDLSTTLQAEYCPPLDAALLSAILSDCDVTQPASLRDARRVLDRLKASAQFEAQLGFDPSGTGARDEGMQAGARPESCSETSESIGKWTDLTSSSNGVTAPDPDRRLEPGGSIPGDGDIARELGDRDIVREPGDSDIARELESQDGETKINVLHQIVDGRVSRSQIEFILTKCNGGFERAVDELLNHVHFGEVGEDGTQAPAKGIDAFSEEHIVRRGRRGKARKKAWASIGEPRPASPPSSPVSAAPTSNAWQSSGKDIDFVATRVGKPSAVVASIYYKHGASIPRTIGELLKSNLKEGNEAIVEDPVKAVNAHELHLEFPGISLEYVAALISLTYPSTAAARELAQALTVRPTEPGGIQIIPVYARPDSAALAAEPEHGPTYFVSATPFASNDPASRASAYAAARSAALAQAYAAHRRAKSDRLMGGVAAYYGQEYRNFTALSMEASAAVADQRAAAQSNVSKLDLHGIDVRNAVRIAEAKVDAWWSGLGEDRVNGRIGASNRHAGYEVVVGRGTHSEGGRSKIGPAVSKALRNAGWKIELDGPVIFVTGRARKRA